MCSVGNSSQSLRGCFPSVAGPAQAFKVRGVIGPPMRLSLDVVNGGSGDCAPITQTFLAQAIIARQDTRTPDRPVVTIASLMPALTLLVSLPAGVLMVGTVARAVRCRLAASMLTACTRYPGWHGLTPPELAAGL